MPMHLCILIRAMRGSRCVWIVPVFSCDLVDIEEHVGIFDQTYSCLTRVIHEVITLYTHPLTVG